MKRIFFICLIAISLGQVNAQGSNDFSYIDNRPLNIPEAETHSTGTIANYINNNFKTDGEKFRAIYSWVTANIKYSTDSMYIINWGADETTKVTVALRRRKGVCENYAAIFNDIALKAGLISYVVTGYTRQSVNQHYSGHSWCAVLLDKKWFLCDPTWDEGFRISPKYFMVSPADFIDSHFPFDPIWQLLPYPVTAREFNRGMGYHEKRSPSFNFIDSVDAFLKLDKYARDIATARRLEQTGIESELQNNWLNYTRMKIAIVQGENDMELYNSAVADLNHATNYFNSFLQYRNNRFTPSKSQRETNAMLEPVGRYILSAWQKIGQIGKNNFQYDVGGISDRLNVLTIKLQAQKAFLIRYFAGNMAERGQLFYR
ncbi:MAG: transglutaminase domain-containing protein [Ferruginibacter sp.]